MKIGKDISARFKDLYLVHQNLPGKKVTSGCYEEHLLFVPLQGEISLQTSNDKITAGPGHMIYLSPGIEHDFSSSLREGERLIAMLSPGLLISPGEEFRKRPLSQFVKELLFYLLLHPETASAKALTAVFAETLGESLREGASAALDRLEGRSLDPRLRKVLDLMRESVSQRLSLVEIAKKAGLSTRNMNRLVLKETGIQPRDWLIGFRIDRARELLRAPGATVTGVAYDVGYSSLGAFIAAFRARTGRLPSEELKLG